MRWSKTFIRTLKETPRDAEVISHILMIRAGLMRKVGSGIYEYLPLGWKIIKKVSQIVRADAGVSFDKLINFSLEQNLTGLEEFSGIPGSVGGAVYINIHFFDLLLSAFLIKAKVINSKTAEIIEVINDWFEFGYDKSKLQQKNFYLLNADFKIIEKDKLVIKKAVERRNEIIKYREERYPTEKTCGSFFRNLNSSEAPVQQNGEKIIHAALLS